MRRILTPLACLAMLAAAPARAEPVVIQPSSPWNVDFGDDKCRLARFFGEGEYRHLLSFEMYWPDVGAGMMVAGPAMKPFASLRQTDLQFYAAQAPRETEPFGGRAGEYGDALIYSSVRLTESGPPQESYEDVETSLPGLDTAFGEKAGFVRLKQGRAEIRLETGPMGKAFELLNQCTLGLVESWGLDPEKHRTLTRMARWTNSRALVRRIQESYPIAALSTGEQGILRMRVIVSETGTVESCTLLKSTVTRNLDSPACKFMQRATFEPALDAEGKPMRSYFVTSITYRGA
ncbi:MAG TPA: energy transducer TonB [Erythrobacter sp.]